ncbi:MAG: hypothetical protein U0N30_19170 [Blautia faecis]
MKGKKITEWLANKKVVSSCAAIALAAVIGGVSLFSGAGETPEFPSYTDPIMETSIIEDETPLASQPKTTVKTTSSTKTTRKTVKLKKASKKSYTKKLKTKTKVTNKTNKSGNTTVDTKTTVVTKATAKYTKKSKKKVVTSKITTTVQTTTTQQVSIANETAVSTTSSGTSAAQATAAASSSQNQSKYEANVANVASVAGKMDNRVIAAYQQLGFKLVVDPSVNYSGYFDARSRSITMKQIDDSVYHELGHFLAFIAGNVDKTASFQSIFAAEKANVTAFNKAYVTQNASEYFAESVKDYILNNASLKSTRPQTYAAVQNALNQITDAQIAKIQKIYGAFWN